MVLESLNYYFFLQIQLFKKKKIIILLKYEYIKKIFKKFLFYLQIYKENSKSHIYKVYFSVKVLRLYEKFDIE